MKKTIATIGAVLALLIATALPASASYHGQVLYNWSHANSTAINASVTNESDVTLGNEGLARFRATGPGFSVTVDYVRLYRNGTPVRQNELDVTTTLGSNWWERSTGWDLNCHQPNGNYYTTVRFKFTHNNLQHSTPHTSGWVVNNSNTWTDPRDCP